jgi:hypothetical protein
LAFKAAVKIHDSRYRIHDTRFMIQDLIVSVAKPKFCEINNKKKEFDIQME